MNWKAANEQQDEALWRVFLMFIALALLVIRTGLVSRGVVAILPATIATQGAVPQDSDCPSSTPPADLYRATLVLLCLAEVAGRLFILQERAVWELMNLPLPRPAQHRRSKPPACANTRHNASIPPDDRRPPAVARLT